MFAVVRFLDDLEKRLVIPVTDIKNFKPANVSDFDKHATYTAFWRDPIGDEGTAYYDAQVLMLAVSSGKEDCDRGDAASKILRNKKSTLVLKDTAEAIWGRDSLAMKSVTGTVAPRKKSHGEAPKDPLTPEKVAVIAATVKHWGGKTGEDVQKTLDNMNHLLTEKIQDVLKSKRRMGQ
ncbi:hypothetical protein MTO96_039658 [Rhipicephalus appendiculatus]